MVVKGFAKQIRALLKSLPPETEITYAEISEKLDCVFDVHKQPVYNVIRNMVRRGEVIRVRRGVVKYVRKYQPKPASKTECMYRFIRANRRSSITPEDLIANCDVEKKNARQYLCMLVNRGICRRIAIPNSNNQFKYQMIKDPGPNLVRNDENRDKLRRIRADRQEAVKQIDAAMNALVEAKKILLTTEDTENTE